MRLQRGKLERERQKHVAEHAFDYVAPPAPKNIQAISKLALPASSRVISSQKKAADLGHVTLSRESHNTSSRPRSAVRRFDDQQPVRLAAAAQPPMQHHMAPAVAAALAKYQVAQNAHAVPVAAAAEDCKSLVDASPHAVAMDPPSHFRFESAASSQIIQEQDNLPDDRGADSRHQAPEATARASAANDDRDDGARPHHVVEDAARVVDATDGFCSQRGMDFVAAQKLSDCEKQVATEQQDRSAAVPASTDSKATAVDVNLLQKFVTLLNFEDNRYGDDDADAAPTPAFHSPIMMLPNAEIGGSASIEEFFSSSSSSSTSSGDSVHNDDRVFVPLRLKLPLCEDEPTLHNTQVASILPKHQPFSAEMCFKMCCDICK
jgi:hypothetical protein